MLENILSYDYHPILVHIPIAFLTIYTLLEICTSFFVRLNTKTVFYIKAFLMLIGIVGVSGALATGEVASQLNRDFVSRTILRAHEEWAEFTSGFFWIPAILYILMILSYERSYFEAKIISLFGQQKIIITIFSLVSKVSNFVQKNHWILVIFALVGLVAVTVTGALGGALVYGKDADPFIQIVISILGL
jgi:uncharacterized membrane protein